MKMKLAKLNASPAADVALDRMLIRVNEGFSGGRVTKTQLTSWLKRRLDLWRAGQGCGHVCP